MAPFNYDEDHLRATLATLDTQLYSVAPREHIVAPASKIKTDRLTVRQIQVGTIDMAPSHPTRASPVDAMDMPNITYKVDAVDMPNVTMKVSAMDTPFSTYKVAAMDMPHVTYKVGEMDMPNLVHRVSALDASPQVMAVQRVLDRLQ